MEEELFALINRTELAAQNAERSGFHDTAQALRIIATALGKPEKSTTNRARSLQYSH